MPGVQTLLPVMLSPVAVKKLSLQDFVLLTSSAPAMLVKLKGKGQIKIGYDAVQSTIRRHKRGHEIESRLDAL